MSRAPIFVGLTIIVGGILNPVLAGSPTFTAPIQMAQATSVTKFRGLFLGMSASELDAAVAAIGATKEKFTDLFSQKVDPNKFNLKSVELR